MIKIIILEKNYLKYLYDKILQKLKSNFSMNTIIFLKIKK